MMRKLIIGDNNFTANTPWGGWSAFFMTVCFFIFQLVISVAVGAGLVVAQHGAKVFKGEFEPSAIPSFIDIGILAVLAGYVLTYGFVLFAGVLRGGTIGEALLMKPPVNFARNIVFGIVALLVFFLSFSFVVEMFFAKDGVQSEAQMKQIFEVLRQSSMLWAGVLIIVVGAPFLEETIFRGFLLTSLSKTRLGFWGAAVVSSGLWAAIHGYALSLAVGLFVFGLLLSLLVRRTGSIWVSILLHAIWNGGVTAAVFAAMKVGT